MLATYQQRVQEDCLPAPLLDKVIQIDNDHQLIVKVNQANYGAHKFLVIYMQCNHNLVNREFIEVIVDNELVQMHLKFICMENDELQKHCGNRDHITYRSILINNLRKLWD